MRLGRSVPLLVLTALFLLAVTPLVRRPALATYDEYDEVTHHYPTILQFMSEWPRPDIVHVRSATGPLYHGLLAASGFVVGPGIVGLRAVNALISFGCLMAIYAFLARRPSRMAALLVSATLLFSPYFLGPAVRLSTDNLALGLVVGSWAAMESEGTGIRSRSLANLLILLAILTRQFYAWLIGSYVLTELRALFRRPPEGFLLRDVAVSLAPALLPVAGLAVLVAAWGGLTPPAFAQHLGTTFNWDAPVFILSLLACYAPFVVVSLDAMRREVGVESLWLCVTAGIALLVLILHPVSSDYPMMRGGVGMRGGWLWVLASHTPSFWSTALAFWILFPLGCVCAVVLARYALERGEYVMLVSFSLLILASIVSVRTYQKYYEPLLLIGLGQLVGWKQGWQYWIGLAILLAGHAFLAWERFFAVA